MLPEHPCRRRPAELALLSCPLFTVAWRSPSGAEWFCSVSHRRQAMPKPRAILAAFSLMIFAAVVAHAQGAVVTSAQVGQGRGAGVGSGSGSGVTGGVIGSILGPGISGIPGQPLSADVIDETDRFLADGNHIHRENHGRMFRDSQGRTRNETEIGNPAPGTKPFMHIMISDPVEGRFILLNPEQK